MPLQDSTNTQTRNPGRDVKDVLERRSRDRGEGLSTLTPRVNDNSMLNRVLRESARQSPERQLLRRRLDGLGLRENEVDGDGNCQFRAIADQLYGSPERDAEVRANIVEHLRSNSSRYSAFVPESYDAYIEIMGLDGNWGDHLTLIAASNVYGLEIRVYTSYDRNWERVIRPTDDGNIRRVIQLSFYAELHYNSVHPITNEGQNPGRDAKDVLGRRSRDRGEGLSTLTPRVNDNSTLNRVLRESARQSPERQLLRRRLDGLGLRENEVDGDGNCQFRAIADQLYGSPERYAEVRANIVEHLRSNSSRYSAFVPESYDAYIEIMGLDGNWGDHLTLIAASNVYGLEIRVYTSYDRNWERVIRPTDDGNIRRVIQLSFYAELHYNSVHPITNEGQNPGRDVKDVLGRRSRDRGEGLSTLTPRVNDNSTLNRVLRESARQSPERQLLRRRLDGLGLRENEVDGDGNCQFRAIADQLYGSSDRYAEVRANIVEHLRSNSSRYSAFVPESYDAYIEIMGLDGNWGDHLTLIAASNVYGLEIRVYTSYDRNWERVIRPTDDGNIRRVIQLSFYAELHYNSVHPITNGCSKCPKSAGPERCQYCSPENFCCVPEHGNSLSFVTDKVMCPKCSPNNFCRDPKHGNSEDNPAHKSSCRICSHGYFNNVSNEQVNGREGGRRGNQPMHTRLDIIGKQEEQIMAPRHKKDTDLVTIYILKCKEKKWYVGKTSKYGATKRIVQHFANNGGSNWTRRYKPIKVDDVKYNQTSRDEDKWTKVYMDRYGVENVRGGAYCKLELNEDQKRALDIESAGSNDLCYHCKKKGHFMAQCKEKYEEEEEEEEYEYFCEMCEECGEEFDEEEKFKRHQRTCNPAVNFNPLVSTMNYEPPETRLHIIGQRLCEQCGITDISNKRDSHTRCYKCHSGKNDYMLQGGGRRTMHNSSRHNSYGEGRGRGGRRGPHTRSCRDCRTDISDRDESHQQCKDCWSRDRSSRGGREGQRRGPYRRR